MTITSSIANSFKQQMLAGTQVINSDTFKMALYTTSATLGPSTTAYTATNEVTGSGYVAGGVTLAGNTVWTDVNAVGIAFSNPTFPASSTMTVSNIEGAMIYNSSRANACVAVFDFGGATSITSGTLTINVPANTTAAGLIKFL